MFRKRDPATGGSLQTRHANLTPRALSWEPALKKQDLTMKPVDSLKRCVCVCIREHNIACLCFISSQLSSSCFCSLLIHFQSLIIAQNPPAEPEDICQCSGHYGERVSVLMWLTLITQDVVCTSLFISVFAANFEYVIELMKIV